MGKVILVVVLLLLGFYCWKHYNLDLTKIFDDCKNKGIGLIHKLDENVDKTKKK
jgi:hypothetical protein